MIKMDAIIRLLNDYEAFRKHGAFDGYGVFRGLYTENSASVLTKEKLKKLYHDLQDIADEISNKLESSQGTDVTP